MQKIYRARAEEITSSTTSWTFSNNGKFAGFSFTNPDDTTTVFVDGWPIPPLQSETFSVYPGQECGNRNFDINLNGSSSSIYGGPLVYGE